MMLENELRYLQKDNLAYLLRRDTIVFQVLIKGDLFYIYLFDMPESFCNLCLTLQNNCGTFWI